MQVLKQSTLFLAAVVLLASFDLSISTNDADAASALFRKKDTNNDGDLQVGELSDFLSSMDTSPQNGQIVVTEFMTMWTSYSLGTYGQGTTVFGRLADKSGLIHLLTDVSIVHRILDKDGDGEVREQEFVYFIVN